MAGGARVRRTPGNGGGSDRPPRSRRRRRSLPWLRDAGLDLEQTDRYGRTPLLFLLAVGAPAEPIRALADAGANLRAATPRHRTDVPSLIAERHRTDLDFLLTAYEETPS